MSSASSSTRRCRRHITTDGRYKSHKRHASGKCGFKGKSPALQRRPLPVRLPRQSTTHDRTAECSSSHGSAHGNYNHAPTPSRTLFPKARRSLAGKSRIAGRGVCTLNLELQEKRDERGEFSGFSSMICNYVAPLAPKDRVNSVSSIINRLDPEAAVLSGVFETGMIHFHVDQVVGADRHGCTPSGFRVTLFGALIDAAWKEATCAGGGTHAPQEGALMSVIRAHSITQAASPSDAAPLRPRDYYGGRQRAALLKGASSITSWAARLREYRPCLYFTDAELLSDTPGCGSGFGHSNPVNEDPAMPADSTSSATTNGSSSPEREVRHAQKANRRRDVDTG
jgi:hypothetical protein